MVARGVGALVAGVTVRERVTLAGAAEWALVARLLVAESGPGYGSVSGPGGQRPEEGFRHIRAW